MAARRHVSGCLRDLGGARIGQCIRYEPALGQRGARACFQAAAGPCLRKPGFRPGTFLDCHRVADEHSSMGGEHMSSGAKVSVLVPPSTCRRCHADQVEQFNASGHFRADRQIIPEDSPHALTQVHEGRSHPEFGDAPNETGCMQCHGTKIELDEDGSPTPGTWPNAGMGNIYPDGSTGNCSACHTRHAFPNAEARRPRACASCHLRPDHPNIEIFENSKHGHVYNTQGEDWNREGASDAWTAGVDYRAPTCSSCHMSAAGEQPATHNVPDRLYWVLWSKSSPVRNSDDPMSPILGDGPKGRERVKEVCAQCHSSLHENGFFAQGDKAVNLYNEAYYKPAKAMLDVLKEKGLLEDNPWSDEFQITFYCLWHHEGRRARQGTLMGGPDFAHWLGFFELRQDL